MGCNNYQEDGKNECVSKCKKCEDHDLRLSSGNVFFMKE
jgi:hypothetical protein